MSGLLAIIAMGFALGMRHACDPDHVVAISTIVARHRRVGAAAMLGATWGIGHAVTIIAVGAAIIGFSVVIPPRLGLSIEFAVGLMLIVLGVANLSGLTHRIFHRLSPAVHPEHSHKLLHSHEHSHDGLRHSHVHFHLMSSHETARWIGRVGAFRALAIGVVHGMAGSAAMALLVMSTIPSQLWSAVYLAVFGLGTIAGMMLISTAMAAPIAFGALSEKMQTSMVAGSGILSVVFGVFVVVRIGFVEGLF